ncbi:uncharacterized protein F5Z01DRAFT_641793 [Emericellopsis atlantica]|uniref:Ankyrin repeat-containing protein n=1 Tax=Emericellopsis atlantica TaxID=2614577 RepID=A0A9P8CU54_9HYPO|nr:uncharacterized protein F5Z01DRAFT_641793 [Emericellopsis atlantica]KAG9258927.1 hypothetical protein F5Z01DRAFT_641793 [Emericellopsis atlantica]
MFWAIFVAMLLNPFRPCEGSPTFQEEYRGNYVPEVIDTQHGLQIVAPDTPYVAAAGQNKLYFIDTRFDVETARHVKEQIERATVPHPDEYISIDEVSATAELKNSLTGETTFVFDPPYARVLFAKGINKRNPELRLPEHEPAGDWLVAYDLVNTHALAKRYDSCSDYGCHSNSDCIRQTNGNCRLCHHYRVDDECDAPLTNAIGVCRPLCSKKADTPKEDGETDSSYYQRMDKLHWANE